jgi:hypothetical protein
LARPYADQACAGAIAIEGVDAPEEQEVRVMGVETGEVVWRSTDEEYESPCTSPTSLPFVLRLSRLIISSALGAQLGVFGTGG